MDDDPTPFERRRFSLLSRPRADERQGTPAAADAAADASARPHAPRWTPSPERRRRTVAHDLYKRIRRGESFWTCVYPLYMRREITRADVRAIVQKGLQEARGNYRLVTKLFNLPPGDYKRFLNFLRKHDCEVPFHEYRR